MRLSSVTGVQYRQREPRNVRRRWELTGIMITPDNEPGDEPDRDPDEDAMIEHPDLDKAEYEDDHGPAFRTRYPEEPLDE